MPSTVGSVTRCGRAADIRIGMNGGSNQNSAVASRGAIRRQFPPRGTAPRGGPPGVLRAGGSVLIVGPRRRPFPLLLRRRSALVLALLALRRRAVLRRSGPAPARPPAAARPRSRRPRGHVWDTHLAWPRRGIDCTTSTRELAGGQEKTMKGEGREENMGKGRVQTRKVLFSGCLPPTGESLGEAKVQLFLKKTYNF